MGYVKEQMGYEENAGEALEPLAEDERAALIRALKTKWDAVNEKYQRMCHMVKLDTVGKVKRKEGMEYELKRSRPTSRSSSGQAPCTSPTRERGRAGFGFASLLLDLSRCDGGAYVVYARVDV